MPRPAAVRLPLVVLVVTLLAIGVALAAAHIGTAWGSDDTPYPVALPACPVAAGDLLIVHPRLGAMPAADTAYDVVRIEAAGRSCARGTDRR